MNRLTHFSLAGAALLVANLSLATPEAGDRSFTISGSGSSDKSFDNNTYGLSAEWGTFTSNASQWGIRQSLGGVNRDHGEDSWAGSTRLFWDYHFLNAGSQWAPYLGVNIGGIYGEDVKNTFAAGPEAGVKYFVLPKTYVGFQMEYQFLFNSADRINNNFDDGAFFYSLGVGFHF